MNNDPQSRYTATSIADTLPSFLAAVSVPS
jgi:hypothetical protein